MDNLKKLSKEELLVIIKEQYELLLCRDQQIRSRESEIEQLELKLKTLKTNKKK